MNRIINNPNYAVRFNDAVDMGLGENKMFPFLYNFVAREDDDWTGPAVAGTPDYQNLEGIGPQVAPGGHIMWPIRLDPDFCYLIQWFKYTVYHGPELALTGYRWYEPVVGWGLNEFADYQTYIGTPLTHYIRVKVAVASQNIILYGTKNLDPQSNNNQFGDYTPLAVNVAQGYDYGYGQLATPYLAPKNGVIIFDIFNQHTAKALVVGGCVYGFKVRL